MQTPEHGSRERIAEHGIRAADKVLANLGGELIPEHGNGFGGKKKAQTETKQTKANNTQCYSFGVVGFVCCG